MKELKATEGRRLLGVRDGNECNECNSLFGRVSARAGFEEGKL